MQIVYAINAMVLREARAAKILDDAAISNISVIDESGERRVRMANLAFAGSHSVNGVAALHTELMKQTVFADLHKLYPGRINNKTNGVTPRRWLLECNPGLTSLIREAIGDAFMDDAEKLTDLIPFAKRQGLRREAGRREARQQGSARHTSAPPYGRAHRPDRALRRADQAHPRI